MTEEYDTLCLLHISAVILLVLARMDSSRCSESAVLLPISSAMLSEALIISVASSEKAMLGLYFMPGSETCFRKSSISAFMAYMLSACSDSSLFARQSFFLMIPSNRCGGMTLSFCSLPASSLL